MANRIGYPVLLRPSYVLGGRGMELVQDVDALRRYMVDGGAGLGTQSGAGRQVPGRGHRGRCRRHRGRHRRLHRRRDAADRGGRGAFGRFRLRPAALFPAARGGGRSAPADPPLGPPARRRRSDERAVRHPGRRYLCARGQSARQPDRALRGEGDRRCPWPRSRRGSWQASRSPASDSAEPRLDHVAVKEGGSALRPLPGQRRHPRSRDEIDRRVHGHRSGLRNGLSEGPARRGCPPAAIRERAAFRAGCRQACGRRCGPAPRASRLPPPGDPRNRGSSCVAPRSR